MSIRSAGPRRFGESEGSETQKPRDDPYRGRSTLCQLHPEHAANAALRFNLSDCLLLRHLDSSHRRRPGRGRNQPGIGGFAFCGTHRSLMTIVALLVEWKISPG